MSSFEITASLKFFKYFLVTNQRGKDFNIGREVSSTSFTHFFGLTFIKAMY